MAVDLNKIPIRMCAVVPLDNGQHQAFCIACGWVGSALVTPSAAERQARRHSCRKRGDAAT